MIGQLKQAKRLELIGTASRCSKTGSGRLGEGAANHLQELRGQMGEHGQGLGFDLGAHAVGLAQEDGGVGLALFAFGDDFCDKHAYLLQHCSHYVNSIVSIHITYHMPTFE